MSIRWFLGNLKVVTVVEGVEDLVRFNSFELLVEAGRVESDTLSYLAGVISGYVVVVRLILLRLGDDTDLWLLHLGFLLVLSK